ncbi:MAG TPA: hypothetical protein ENK52_05705 [Saprospiraceae bacterium]|nr:hypothetical protein [Saprospiraceae bacterium]
MKFAKTQILVLLLFLPIFSFAQVLDYIDIQLNIFEKLDNKTKPLPNAKLKISEMGEVQADDFGSYSFKYPVRPNEDPILSIALLSDVHKTLKPLDGAIVLNPAKDKMTIDFFVVNVAKVSPQFKKRIKNLENRIASLKAKEELTQGQLIALNEVLVDTIMFFENNRKRLESEMNQLKENLSSLENLTAEQKQKIEEQNAKIEFLNEKVDKLTTDLEAALEKRYLRQNEYFKNISQSLLQYLQRVKDIRDQLPHIKEYFKIKGDMQANYNSNNQKYNKAFTKLNTEYQNYIEGVERYWDNKTLAKELEAVYKYLLTGVHLRQIYPLVNELNNEIRKSRPKKAEKIANEAYPDMVVNIRKLEKDVNKILTKLRLNL